MLCLYDERHCQEVYGCCEVVNTLQYSGLSLRYLQVYRLLQLDSSLKMILIFLPDEIVMLTFHWKIAFEQQFIYRYSENENFIKIKSCRVFLCDIRILC